MHISMKRIIRTILKLKWVGDHVRISKYKRIIGKDYVQNWAEKAFVIKKVEKTFQRTYAISGPKGEEIIGTFYKKELQKSN